MVFGVHALHKLELKGLNVEWEKDGDLTIVHLKGRITNENSYELNHKIHRIFESGNFNVILDLAELDFINSTGIAIIFSILSRASDHGGRVVIGGMNPFLQNIFSLMELPAGLDVQETIEEAKKSFHS